MAAGGWSMGPLGWLLFGWVYLCVLAAVGLGFLVWLVVRFLWLTVVELASLVRRG